MRPEPGMNMSIWGEEPKIFIYIYDDDETFIKVEVLHLFRCYTHMPPSSTFRQNIGPAAMLQWGRGRCDAATLRRCDASTLRRCDAAEPERRCDTVLSRSVEAKIPFNVWVRGGGGFESFWRSVEINIPSDLLVRGGCGFHPLCRKVVKWISQWTDWSEGVAVLIPPGNQLKLISHATYWSEGVANLRP